MIGIVTVVYNQLDFVRQTVEAVLEKTTQPFLYVLVTNNPPYPGVMDYIKSLNSSRAAEIVIVENKENIGITGALKQGFDYIRSHGCSIMVKVDDDTVIDTLHWTYVFAEAFLRYRDLGILSADIDNGKQVGPSTLTTKSGLQLEEFQNPCVGGAFTAYPCWLFEKIGFFKNFGYYGQEDGEFANRVANMGLKTGYLQNVKCRHLGRSEASDKLYDQWKLISWSRETELDYPSWRKELECQAIGKNTK